LAGTRQQEHASQAGLLGPAAVLVAGLATVLIAAFALAAKGGGGRPVDVTTVLGAHGGSAVPALAGVDLLTGRRLEFSASGRRALVLIGASHCVACARAVVAVRRFALTHRNVVVLAIDSGEAAAPARAFYHRLNWRLPVVLDPGAGLANELGVNVLPTTLVTDRDRRVVLRLVGATVPATLQQGLKLATRS
jgi:thiol-disulfide isomerase/thioredoxin